MGGGTVLHHILREGELSGGGYVHGEMSRSQEICPSRKCVRILPLSLITLSNETQWAAYLLINYHHYRNSVLIKVKVKVWTLAIAPLT